MNSVAFEFSMFCLVRTTVLVSATAIIALIVAWICEKLLVCEEFVTFVWMAAPRTMRCAIMLAVISCINYNLVSDASVWARVLSFIGIMFCIDSVSCLLEVYFKIYEKCSVLKRFYLAFEEFIHIKRKRLPSFDVIGEIAKTLDKHFSTDVYGAAYFTEKCAKLCCQLDLDSEKR